MDPANLPNTFRQWITFIEFHAEKNEPAKCENMEMIMDRLGAERCPREDTSPFCAYKIDKPLTSCSTDWKPKATKLLEPHTTQHST